MTRFVAFLLAVLLGPLSIALMSLLLGPFALIAVYAIALGGPCYLAFGGPAFALLARFGALNIFTGALAGFVVNAGVFNIALAINELTSGPPVFPNATTLLNWGMLFAPLWGAGCGGIYQLLTCSPSETTLK